MEIVLIIVAFWLVLLLVYGAWPYFGGINLRPPGGGAASPPDRDLARRYNDEIAAAAAALTKPAVRPIITAVEPQPLVAGLSREVDMLRLQIEELRSELAAVTRSSPPFRQDRPRLRRYRTGVYTYLPRLLRLHIREARSNRRNGLLHA